MSHFAGARILVVDDEPEVLEAYKRVFTDIVASPADELHLLATELFETETTAAPSQTTIAAIDLCRQGEEAVQKIQTTRGEQSYYPVAFIDIRMPPGIDGLETAKRLRYLSPDISIVVVTGYSDYPPQEIAQEVGSTDRFYYLVKPFQPDELLQLTVTLLNRWKSERDAADTLAIKMSELGASNAALVESEAKAKELKEQVDQLRLEIAAKIGSKGRFSKDGPGDPRSLQAASHAPGCTADSLRAAFREGRAAFDPPLGVGLCPYSAATETELFSAWIAGYRSREDGNF